MGRRSCGVGANRITSGCVNVYGEPADLDAALAAIQPLLAKLAANGWSTHTHKLDAALIVSVRSCRGLGKGALRDARRHWLVEIAAAVRAAWKGGARE